MNELKEKLVRLSRVLDTSIYYEMTYNCDKFNEPFGAFRERHSLKADGFKRVHRCSVEAILNLKDEDFTVEEKGE